MKPSLHLHALGEFLSSLLDQLPMGTFDAVSGTGVQVTCIDLELPLEARLGRGGEVHASLPRGRFATGFQLPHAKLRLRLETEDAAVAAEAIEEGAARR